MITFYFMYGYSGLKQRITCLFNWFQSCNKIASKGGVGGLKTLVIHPEKSSFAEEFVVNPKQNFIQSKILFHLGLHILKRWTETPYREKKEGVKTMLLGNRVLFSKKRHQSSFLMAMCPKSPFSKAKIVPFGAFVSQSTFIHRPVRL